jgi:predicted PurR-regulated permease PerM
MMKNERPVRVVSRFERRVTLTLKIVLLIAVSAYLFAGAVDFFGRIRSVVVVLIGAVFFTYLIYPLVRRLHERMPLIWAILIVYAGIALVAAFALSVLVPAITAEVQAFAQAYPALIQSAQAFFTDPNNPLIARLPQSARDYLATIPGQLGTLAQHYAAPAVSQALSVVLSAVSILATIVVIPILSIYLIVEFPGWLDVIFEFIPPAARPKTAKILKDLDGVLGGFIRGQLTVGAVIGTAIGVMLLILHVKYAVLIGVAAGILDLIPYVGAVVAFIPATLIAYFSDGWQHALTVAVLFALIFQLEGQFISPRIISGSVGLSPLGVIIAILIGGDLGGVFGMFISVPIAAALRVLLIDLKPDYKTTAKKSDRAH